MIPGVALLLLLRSLVQQPPEVNRLPTEGIYKYFGSIVGKAGDVNGDGVPDFVLGDPGYQSEGIPPRLWIVSGVDGHTIRSVTFPSQNLPDIEVEGGTDLDGDGVPDLVVGIHCSGTGVAGAVYVVSGKTGQTIRTLEACSDGCGSSGWVHLISDIDRDGIRDIGVLCSVTREGQGSLSVYSGRTGSRILDMPVKNESNTYAGSFVEVPSVHVERPREFAVLFDVGRYLRATSSQSRPTGGMPPSSLRFYSPGQTTALRERLLTVPHEGPNAVLARLGMAGPNDAPEFLLSYGERVEVVNGLTGETRLHFEMKLDGESGLGCALTTLGDLDHDGIPDLIISEYDTGDYDGMVMARSGKDGRVLWSVKGNFIPDDIHHFGYKLAALGDLDGDGVADLAVGTDEGPDGIAHGEAEVLSGKTGKRLYQFRRKGDDLVVTGSLPIGPIPR